MSDPVAVLSDQRVICGFVTKAEARAWLEIWLGEDRSRYGYVTTTIDRTNTDEERREREQAGGLCHCESCSDPGRGADESADSEGAEGQELDPKLP